MSVESILSRILRRKREEVAALRRSDRRLRLEKDLASAPQVRDFRESLTRAGAGFRIIAEVKKFSPSRGLLRADFDPRRIAAAYQEGGSCALSVLTDEAFFGGSAAHLVEARAVSSLPTLRKDFVIDPLQVEEARGMGADAILLIVAVLDPGLLKSLLRRSNELGMTALVEVHDAADLETAVDSGADLIGVNNRDLTTFRVDPAVSVELAPRFPPGCIRVSESGITHRRDLERLSEVGYQAFLVGERLMAEEDPRSLLREWTT